MNKFGLTTFLVILFIFLLGVFLFLKKTPSSESSDENKALNLAKKLYDQQKATGTNFSDGPCLSNSLMPDWVADIAHDPRQPIDDVPANQCSAYRIEKAHHFVELDTQGNLITIH